MSALPRRVIKLGGSLLESADWDQRFANWFATLPPARTLLLVGGGPPVDAIRDMASLRAYDAVFMHWLCIDAMDLSFRIAKCHLNPEWQSLENAEELLAWRETSQNCRALVHIRSFYTSDNYLTLPVSLPLSWDTTSDSLSALLAKIVAAPELILVKSCPVSGPYNWLDLARDGIVDQAFPAAVAGLSQVSISSI